MWVEGRSKTYFLQRKYFRYLWNITVDIEITFLYYCILLICKLLFIFTLSKKSVQFHSVGVLKAAIYSLIFSQKKLSLQIKNNTYWKS